MIQCHAPGRPRPEQQHRRWRPMIFALLLGWATCPLLPASLPAYLAVKKA
jgi:hypothetical protein